MVLRSASTITASAIAGSVGDQASASIAAPGESASSVEDPVCASTYAIKASAGSAEGAVSAFTYAGTLGGRSARKSMFNGSCHAAGGVTTQRFNQRGGQSNASTSRGGGRLS